MPAKDMAEWNPTESLSLASLRYRSGPLLLQKLQNIWNMLNIGTATLVNNHMLEYSPSTSNPTKQKMQSLFPLFLFIFAPIILIFKFNLTYA